ncbi:MAG: hypothetical protein J6J17_02730 [Bacilli bacterium]|nr:hypothetical protein [Bacilli bacterium]
MKKNIVFLIILILFILKINMNEDSKLVMLENNNTNNYHYELIFNKEKLNFRNFKLKLATFTSYEYNIKKVYIENDKENLKKYYSFDNDNFISGIEKIKNNYIHNLKSNYLYNDLDKDIDETLINKIEIYTEPDAINIFKKKYPSVEIISLDEY